MSSTVDTKGAFHVFAPVAAVFCTGASLVKNKVSANICSVHCSYFVFVPAVSSVFCFVFESCNTRSPTLFIATWRPILQERYWSYWTIVLVLKTI